MNNLEYDKFGFAMVSGWELCHCCQHDGAYIGKQDVYVSINSGLPAHAYLDAPPPHPAGHWPCRMPGDDAWVIQQDLRGQTAYNTQTKQPRTITELGALSENETLLSPTSTHDVWDNDKWVADPDAEAAAALAAATATRAAMLAEANQHIDVLGDAVELGIATEDELAAYNNWRRYRVELMRLDLIVTPIAWPIKPA
ncbi:tail fiber assembly protein [Aeromonas veronii]|uniref:tail fiber assembly protein n=1 Tax=Aeromonas veronii TaxID=654 RepID=UPI0021DA845C|nr:tail fiber assembly protein [Aeromonas veronii]UYB71627.1 tail fiber assembly protein [Aeromonas veronii]